MPDESAQLPETTLANISRDSKPRSVKEALLMAAARASSPTSGEIEEEKIAE
jgi:hypothetical protein